MFHRKINHANHPSLQTCELQLHNQCSWTLFQQGNYMPQIFIRANQTDLSHGTFRIRMYGTKPKSMFSLPVFVHKCSPSIFCLMGSNGFNKLALELSHKSRSQAKMYHRILTPLHNVVLFSAIF